MEYIDEELEYAMSNINNFVSVIDACVLEIKNSIRETIKERWLRGDSANGGKIVNQQTGLGYASLSYKNLKLLKNPGADGNVDLTFTGALGDAIDLQLTSSGDYMIISTDSKYMQIGFKYGFDEFGLSEQENMFYMDLLSELITNKLNLL